MMKKNREDKSGDIAPTNDSSENTKKSKPASRSLLTKLAFIFLLILAGYVVTKYVQYHYSKIAEENKVAKFDNVDSEIFDLSDEYKNQANVVESLPLADVDNGMVEELQEVNSEFVYQHLLQVGTQINDLKEEMRALRDEMQRFKNKEKIGKLVFTYIDLRQRIFASVPYGETLKEFEMLSISDQTLYEKVIRLKSLSAEFSGEEKLKKDFQKIITDIIIAKRNLADESLISKVRRNISKLVIVRRIDERDPQSVDSAIVQIEKFLRERNYREAMIVMVALDQKYQEILKEFLYELGVAVSVQEVDQEILNYLRNLS